MEKYHKNSYGKKTNKDNENEFKMILDSIPMALYWKDTDLIYRGSNVKFDELTGNFYETVFGKTDFDLHSEETAKLFRKEDDEYLSGKRTQMYFIDKLVDMKDNSQIWSRTYKIPIFDENSNIKYIMGLIQDITKIKLDEIALAESESRLRTTLNATDNCIAFVDSKENVLMVNGRFLNDFAHEKNYIQGMHLSSLIAQPFFLKLQDHLIKAFETREPLYFEVSPVESQTNKIFNVSVNPILTENGIIGTAIFAMDITQWKLNEQMLIKYSEELKATAALAESASKSKGDFLSRMSHEIRTPLSSIIGMAKIANSSDDLLKIKDCLKKIDNSSKHLLSIINDVLDMSKIEAEKFNLTESAFRLETLLIDVADLINVRANEKEQNFEIILDENLPEYFYGDELRLHQVITNLLSNSVKFTPDKGTVRLNIRNIGIVEDIATLEIIVSDNGIGITKEHQAKLFQPFEQADGSITRQFGGTGLGLVICQKIVQMMNGHIYLESEENKGSRFTINLKMKVHHPQIKESKELIKFSEMEALIVDDSRETREYLTHILMGFGIKSVTSIDGFDAIRQVQEAKKNNKYFNIFFIDWSMPGMNGIETTRKLKSITENNSVVIMISIIEWDKIEKDAIAAGVNRFLPKPLFPSTVMTILNEIAGVPDKCDIFNIKNNIPNLTGYKFLIAEDIEINREIASAILEPTHVEIDFAVNGMEAVEKFNANKNRYDLILMDIHMPYMDGLEASKRIRSNNDEKSLSIPIIAMTADAFKEDIDKCREAGMNNHIAKPINEEELFKKILICKNQKVNMGNQIFKIESEEINECLLDEREALKRLGNKKFYIKLLKTFLENESYNDLKRSLLENNLKNAQFAAHSIKGIAANLSLTAVFKASTEIDLMLKNNQYDEQKVHDFETIMEKTIDYIKEYISDLNG